MTQDIKVIVFIDGVGMQPITIKGKWTQSIFYSSEESIYVSGWLYKDAKTAIARYGFRFDRLKEGS